MSDTSTDMTDHQPGEGDTRTLRAPDYALLEMVLDAIPARVAVLDTNFTYLYANREFLNFLGRPGGEVVGRAVRDIMGEEADTRIRPRGQRALAGETVRFEGWFEYATGQRRFIHQVITPYRTGEDVIEGIISFTRDLTELKLHEEEIARQLALLQRSEAISAAVIASALDCVIVLDTDYRAVEFNPAAERVFGITRAEAIGREIGDLILPADPQGTSSGLQRFLASGGGDLYGQRLEIEAKRADGTVFPAELALTEVKLPERRLITFHLRDLSDVKRTQSELERQRDRLHQIEKLSAMGSLLAGVAHELNNPLAVVVGQSALLAERAESADTKQRAERIRAAAERCARIVKSFLAMARQKAPHREPLNLNEIVTGSLEMLAYGLRSAGIVLTRDLAPDLPSVDADRDLFSQVVANLTINAQQALSERDHPRTIKVSTFARDDTVVLIVADNGPGIPPQVAARVFEPYFTTKPAGVGTGIGLSICRDVVEAHGGTLALGISTEGGAAFTVTLPASGAMPKTARSGAAAATQRRRALIVDDESDVAASLGEMVEALGHDVVLCERPAEGLELLASGGFDIAFVDLRMPSMNGAQFRKAAAARDPSLAAHIVIMTGDIVAGPRLIAQVSGEEKVIILEKPFTLADVRQALAAVKILELTWRRASLVKRRFP
ncbi:hypothetical protein BH10PSE7_BH10PSE7_32800 [soil metagenome]